MNRDTESETNNREYKYTLNSFTVEDNIDVNVGAGASVEEDVVVSEPIIRLTNQLIRRLDNSRDKRGARAYYYLGYMDDGFALGLTRDEMDKSLKNLAYICHQAKSQIRRVKESKITIMGESHDEIVDTFLYKSMSQTDRRCLNASRESDDNLIGFERFVAEVVIQKLPPDGYTEVRIAMMGNVDAGKSTLTGCLSQGKLDDGRGIIRTSVLTHPHEIKTGRTSYISQAIIGYDNEGKSVNRKLAKYRLPKWEDIIRLSSKVVHLFDLAGHEAYLKTTSKGLNSYRTDCNLILVSAHNGRKMTQMTREHLNMAILMGSRFSIVITKIDTAPVEKLKATIETVKTFLKKRHFNPIKIKTNEEATEAIEHLKSRVIPIFQVSNVTGEGLEQLETFLVNCKSRKDFHKYNKKPVQFQVHERYLVTGVGLVVGGMLFSGSISIGQKLNLGPDRNGNFRKVKIRSIHRNRVSVNTVEPGVFACLALAGVSDKELPRSAFLIDDVFKSNIYWTFPATIYIGESKRSCHISEGYETVCQIGHVRTTCRLEKIVNIEHRRHLADSKSNSKILGVGDSARVIFRSLYRPLLITGEKCAFLFHEGPTIGQGLITLDTDSTDI